MADISPGYAVARPKALCNVARAVSMITNTWRSLVSKVAKITCFCSITFIRNLCLALWFLLKRPAVLSFQIVSTTVGYTDSSYNRILLPRKSSAGGALFGAAALGVRWDAIKSCRPFSVFPSLRSLLQTLFSMSAKWSAWLVNCGVINQPVYMLNSHGLIENGELNESELVAIICNRRWENLKLYE